MDINSHEFKICGIDVRFPYCPYVIQRSIMSKIIEGLTRQTKSIIIESPTGTGKSICILSAVLAWQLASEKRIKIDETKMSSITESLHNLKSSCYCIKDDKIAPFECRFCQKGEALEDSMPGYPIVPQIYYCTRTHKQITQVVKELRKLKDYRDVRMTILSSRSQTCINEDVKRSPNLNHECRRLIDNKQVQVQRRRQTNIDTCSFYAGQDTLFYEFEKMGVGDIEDALEYGRERSLCPYYGLRSLRHEAQLIFCPYNFILNTAIRQSMGINIKNAILIFDEAHNVEDICLSSAKFETNSHQLHDFISYFQELAQNPSLEQKRLSLQCMIEILTKIVSFLEGYSSFDPHGQSEAEKSQHLVAEDTQMINLLSAMGIDQETLKKLRTALDNSYNSRHELSSLDADEIDTNSNDDLLLTTDPSLDSSKYETILQLLTTFDLMLRNNSACINRFKMHIIKDNHVSINQNHLVKLTILCLDASATFKQIEDQVWSTIFASGTLSPMDALNVELGIDTRSAYSGPHVIEKGQILARIVTRGPNGVDMRCSRGVINDVRLMMEIGSIILDLCQKTPGGLLCFFTSYSVLNLLHSYWVTKGVLADITSAGKQLYVEEQNMSTEALDRLIKNHISNSSQGSGSILFAVMRGKLSEGLDLPDSSVRSVITIGIPIPHIDDPFIKAKMSYNDKRGGINGSEWLQIQAVRSLCQSAGRCIRSHTDWGAIVLIDVRLGEKLWQDYMPRWLRDFVKVEHTYTRFAEEFHEFMLRNRNEPKENLASNS